MIEASTLYGFTALEKVDNITLTVSRWDIALSQLPSLTTASFLTGYNYGATLTKLLIEPYLTHGKRDIRDMDMTMAYGVARYQVIAIKKGRVLLPSGRRAEREFNCLQSLSGLEFGRAEDPNLPDISSFVYHFIQDYPAGHYNENYIRLNKAGRIKATNSMDAKASPKPKPRPRKYTLVPAPLLGLFKITTFGVPDFSKAPDDDVNTISTMEAYMEGIIRTGLIKGEHIVNVLMHISAQSMGDGVIVINSTFYFLIGPYVMRWIGHVIKRLLRTREDLARVYEGKIYVALADDVLEKAILSNIYYLKGEGIADISGARYVTFPIWTGPMWSRNLQPTPPDEIFAAALMGSTVYASGGAYPLRIVTDTPTVTRDVKPALLGQQGRVRRTKEQLWAMKQAHEEARLRSMAKADSKLGVQLRHVGVGMGPDTVVTRDYRDNVSNSPYPEKSQSM